MWVYIMMLIVASNCYAMETGEASHELAVRVDSMDGGEHKEDSDKRDKRLRAPTISSPHNKSMSALLAHDLDKAESNRDIPGMLKGVLATVIHNLRKTHNDNKRALAAVDGNVTNAVSAFNEIKAEQIKQREWSRRQTKYNNGKFLFTWLLLVGGGLLVWFHKG